MADIKVIVDYVLPLVLKVSAKVNDAPLPVEEPSEEPAPGDAPPEVPEGGTAGGSATGGPATSGDVGFGFNACKAKHGISDDDAQALAAEGSPHPFGTDAAGLARQRAYEAGLDGTNSTSDEGSNNARAVPAACNDMRNATEDTQLSRRFKVRHFTRCVVTNAPLSGNVGLSAAEIACNLRHLAINAIEPIFDHFEKLGYRVQLNSGFRRNRGKSDHNRGSAMDLQFYQGGRLITGQHLTRIQKVVDQVLKIPYTQMINEKDRVLHIACRRGGGNSGLRMYWSTGFGSPVSGRGYRYNVSVDGNPRVR